jgi:hypothetical protein
MFVQNILAPDSVEELLSGLKDWTFFSVASDASNKGNIKCYPVVVKYFFQKTGVKEGLLSFCKEFDEISISFIYIPSKIMQYPSFLCKQFIS